jgi:hypothetical protein
MSLTEVQADNAASIDAADAGAVADFKFVPKYLAAKCRQLIETYHAIHGYTCLPDMLWNTEVRDLIDAHSELHKIFRRSSITRSAKKANEGFVLIATLMLALEVLASDYAGWGRRFPWAKRKAEEFRRAHLPTIRTRLMDLYLYPQRYINPAFVNALAPPERPRGPDQNGGREADEPTAPAAAKDKPVHLTAKEIGWPPLAVPALNGA